MAAFDKRNLAPTLYARGWRGTGKLLPCMGWFGNAARIRLGVRPTGHGWKVGDPSEPLDRCHVCGKLRRELMEQRPARELRTDTSMSALQAAIESGR